MKWNPNRMYFACLDGDEDQIDLELDRLPREGDVLEIHGRRWRIEEVAALAFGPHRAMLTCAPLG
jgi:hypothetical protein